MTLTGRHPELLTTKKYAILLRFKMPFMALSALARLWANCRHVQGGRKDKRIKKVVRALARIILRVAKINMADAPPIR